MRPHSRTELVVVTGASTGIGLATALALAGAGFHVLAGVRRTEDADRLLAQDPALEPVLLDVTDEGQIAALADRIRTDPQRRPLRALVNNAGIAIDAPIEVLPLPQWRQQFEVAVFGQVAVTQALLPALIASRGRIVDVGSILGVVPMPGSGPYSGAKAAMHAIGDVLRREVGGFGVDVVTIVPGVVQSRLSARGLATAARIADGMSAELTSRYAHQMRAHVAQAEAYARTGIPAEVAAATILRSIDAARPRIRYTVGRDAALLTAMSRVLPTRLIDRVLLRQLATVADHAHGEPAASP